MSGECSGSGGKKGWRVLNSQAREMLLCVQNYFELEKSNGCPLLPVSKVLDRTSAATKISKRTIIRIQKEKDVKKKEGGARLRTPGKERNRMQSKSCLDSFREDAIRRHIYSYYERREYPTVKLLLFSLKEAELFSSSSFTLRVILKRLGFRWKKVANNRKMLLERSDIVSWRGRFLREILSVPVEDMIWLDETWLNAVRSKNIMCTAHVTMNVPIAKGTRIILLLAGGCEGFVPNAKLLFKAKIATGDYHEEIDNLTFTKWFTEQLIPNIKPNRTIIMDNAPYHNVLKEKYPKVNWRKEDIKQWMSTKNIPFQENMLKAELLDIVKFYEPKFPSYEIDEIAKKHGHNVIRLPPYHCHFNPLELIWEQINSYVAANNKSFKVSEVIKLTNEKIESINAEEWTKLVEHSNDLIQMQAKIERVIEERVEELIISLSNGSSSCDSEELETPDEEVGMEEGNTFGIEGVFPLPQE